MRYVIAAVAAVLFAMFVSIPAVLVTFGGPDGQSLPDGSIPATLLVTILVAEVLVWTAKRT